MASQDIKKGLWHMFFAIFFFALTHASVKWLTHLHFTELVVFRAIISIFMCYWGIKAQKLSLWGSNKKDLILRGAFGTIALTCYFFSLQNMPLATAVTIQYLSPIFTIIISMFILSEPVKPLQWLFFTMAFVGVLIVRQGTLNLEWFTLLIALTASVSAGFAYTWVRKLRSTEHPLTIVFYFPLVTIPIVGPFALYYWKTPELLDIPFILVIGVFTQLAQVQMTKALSCAQASEVGIMNYLGVIYAFAMGVLIFGESYSTLSLVGVLFIIFSVVFAIQYGAYQSRKL